MLSKVHRRPPHTTTLLCTNDSQLIPVCPELGTPLFFTAVDEMLQFIYSRGYSLFVIYFDNLKKNLVTLSAIHSMASSKPVWFVV